MVFLWWGFGVGQVFTGLPFLVSVGWFLFKAFIYYNS